MSSEASEVSVRMLRILAHGAVITLLAENPLGFSHNDVADHIGPQFRAGGADERRLRHQLRALCRSKLLNPVDHGIFIGGDAYVPGERQGLESAINDAFYQAGGSLSLPELMESLTCFDASGRVVAQFMNESGKYFRGLAITGYRQQWFLTGPERMRVPLPGAAQMLELRIFMLHAKVASNVNVIPLLDSFRRRVGSAIRDARCLRGRSVKDIVADPNLSDRLARCFGGCQLRISDPVLGTYHRSIAEWWTQEAQAGLGSALETAWSYLEWGAASSAQPWLLGVLDVACWDALGVALGVNSAFLSRGLVTSA